MVDMPNISGADDKTMAPEDLKMGDILVVYWVEPPKYGAETSVVRFEKFGEVTKLTPNRVIFFSRAEFAPLSVYCYPLEDISEIRFCARDSSASSQIFRKLHGLYRENRRLTERLNN